MKILVFGSTGMLGHTLIKYLQTQSSIEVEFTARNKSRQELCKKIFGKQAKYIVNAYQAYSALKAINDFKPAYCINCLGLIKQRNDSKNFLNYIKVNSLLPHLLSKYSAENNARLIHISTDGVYSGLKGNYSENDNPDPLDFYCRSKLLGEVCNENSMTLRTSIIGPEINSSKGLLEWFKSKNEIVYGYSNVWFTGFPTIELARIIFNYIIKKDIKNDIYNVSSNPINKLNLLMLINNIYGLNKKILEDKSIKVNRTLDCSKFIAETNFIKDEWHLMIKKMKQFG